MHFYWVRCSCNCKQCLSWRSTAAGRTCDASSLSHTLGRASSAMMWVVWMEEVPDGEDSLAGIHLSPTTCTQSTVHPRTELHLLIFFYSKPSFLSVAVTLSVHRHSLIKLTLSRQTLNWTLGLYLLQIIIYFCVLRQEHLLKVATLKGV